jgi:hydroxymethylglutaryl-CoA lyase
MAKDELTGNMDTEFMINYFKNYHLLPPINEEALQAALKLAEEIFV